MLFSSSQSVSVYHSPFFFSISRSFFLVKIISHRHNYVIPSEYVSLPRRFFIVTIRSSYRNAFPRVTMLFIPSKCFFPFYNYILPSQLSFPDSKDFSLRKIVTSLRHNVFLFCTVLFIITKYLFPQWRFVTILYSSSQCFSLHHNPSLPVTIYVLPFVYFYPVTMMFSLSQCFSYRQHCFDLPYNAFLQLKCIFSCHYTFFARHNAFDIFIKSTIHSSFLPVDFKEIYLCHNIVSSSKKLFSLLLYSSSQHNAFLSVTLHFSLFSYFSIRHHFPPTTMLFFSATKLFSSLVEMLIYTNYFTSTFATLLDIMNVSDMASIAHHGQVLL